jgi:hypothetical protein
MEEFHLTVFAPRGLLAQAYDAMRQTLDDPHFPKGLGRAIRRFIRRYPSLSKAKGRLSS